LAITVILELAVKMGLLLKRPFFVVITMTPFPALAPQIDAAAASLRIVIVATSLGFIVERSPSYGKLSITIKGLAVANKVLCPLMLMSLLTPCLLKINPDVTSSRRLRRSVLTL